LISFGQPIFIKSLLHEFRGQTPGTVSVRKGSFSALGGGTPSQDLDAIPELSMTRGGLHRQNLYAIPDLSMPGGGTIGTPPRNPSFRQANLS